MATKLNALPVEACTDTELLTLSTLNNIEKGLHKTWHRESELFSLLKMHANVSPWTGPISSMSFQLRSTRDSVMTSVSCKDPFPIPRKRHGKRIGVSPKLYVDGIDSCQLDELKNRDPGVLFNNLAEEMKAFKEDSMTMLSMAMLYGRGTDGVQTLDTNAAAFVDEFSAPGMSSDMLNGTGFGLLSILGDETLRPEYLTLSGADDGCEFWRAGIYDADVLSALDPSDPDYWDGNLNFENIIRWKFRRQGPNSKYVAICDPATYLEIKLSVERRIDNTNRNPISGGNFDPFGGYQTISFDGVLFVQDELWPANSIGVFDFNEIYLRTIPEFWGTNTGWQASFNSPLNKYLWEMWMFAIYTKRRNAHFMICNPTITDYCQRVSVCNADEIGAVAP